MLKHVNSENFDKQFCADRVVKAEPHSRGQGRKHDIRHGQHRY